MENKTHSLFGTAKDGTPLCVKFEVQSAVRVAVAEFARTSFGWVRVTTAQVVRVELARTWYAQLCSDRGFARAA